MESGKLIWSPRYARIVRTRLEEDIFPDRGHLNIGSLQLSLREQLDAMKIVTYAELSATRDGFHSPCTCSNPNRMSSLVGDQFNVNINRPKDKMCYRRSL